MIKLEELVFIQEKFELKKKENDKKSNSLIINDEDDNVSNLIEKDLSKLNEDEILEKENNLKEKVIFNQLEIF